MKKLLSMLLVLTLVCTTIVVPAIGVSAAANYEDYVPGAKPANMLKTNGEVGVSDFWANMGHTTNKVTVGQTNGYKYSTFKANGTAGETMSGSKNPLYYYINGVYAGSNNIKTNSPGGINGDIDDGKNYVFAMQVRNLDSTYTPNIRLMLYDLDAPAPLDSKEYGSAGMPVTGTSWMDYKGTIQAPERNTVDNANNVDRISIGYNSDAIAGSYIEVNYTDASDGMYPMYFAEEAAYDITNTIVTDSVDIEKNAIVLEAALVNQVGLPGYLNQEFTWVALDSKTRTQEIDGINIVVSDDTTTATVTADESVPNGFYDIVAYSEEYDMAKGVSVAVGEVTKYPDYEASDDMPANIVANPLDANNYTGRWLATFEAIAPNHANGVEGAMRYPIVKNPGYWGDSSSTPLAGGEMTKAIGSYKWKVANYVISTDLKNHPDSTVQESRFVYMIDSRDGTNTSKPYKMLDITSSEWETFNFVLPVTVEGTATSKLHYGYPNHSSLQNPQGTDILHRMGSFYIAEEVAKDIIVESTETEMREGGSLVFSAKIINQLDIDYEGETNIEWMVMDKERLRKPAGFTVTPFDDGTVTVSCEKGVVEGGTYTIIAMDESLGIDGFCKGVEFTVIPYFNTDNGSVTTSAKLDIDEKWSNAMVTTGLVTKAQIKATYAGKNGDFTWFAANEERTTKVDGFTFDIEKDGDTEIATVNLADDITEGKYYIVAEAADGSLAGHPIKVDKKDDILVISQAIAEGRKDDIVKGFEGIYMGLVELGGTVVEDADIETLADILIAAADEENIEDAKDLATLKEIIVRLAALSLYTKNPGEIVLYDTENGFANAEELKISEIDSGDVTIAAQFEAATTEEGKKAFFAAISGEYDSYTEFIDTVTESMLLYALAYPNVNGVDYVSDLFTEANLEAIGIDASAYLALSEPAVFNNTVAGELYTTAKLKKLVEDAEDPEEDEEEDDDTPATKVSKGGGGFSVGSSKKDEPQEDDNNETVAPETYSFSDVSQSHWAYSDIHYLKSIGVIDGVGNNEFAPEANVTREQFLKIIIDAFGIEKKASTKVFGDVDANAWYAAYIAAGVENGIITGTGDNTFGTGVAITRQDACTIIARALKFAEEPDGELNFTDEEEIAAYAKSAVAALSGYAIINGFDDGRFGPNEVCTRAQAAKIVACAIGIVNAINAQQ